MALDGLRSIGHPANTWANEFSDATILTKSECFEHLSQVSLGRIATSIDALPVILPVHFVLSDESVLFPAVTGSILDAATTGTVIAFQADAQEALSADFWSVLIQGIASSVSDGPGHAQGRVTPLEPQPDVQRKLHMVRIEASIVSGRRFRLAGERPHVELPDSPPL
jgi:nitroimidazol reductase NimA-like FMN-containing flavoprotein (pyridoxamine 5'-phosphate oxidase superfamily)